MEEGGSQSAMGICAFFCMSKLFGVVVFQISMLNWRGYICLWYMCIFLYVKLIWCSSFSEIYAQLEEGMQSVCHGNMCILLLVKLIQCTGFSEIYAQLVAKVGGQSAMGISAFFYI